MKYKVTEDLLPIVKKGRRQGIKNNGIRFSVLHDVGNDGHNKRTGKKEGTTARGNVSYYRNTPNVQASAQVFIDDKEILVCIPLNEKAWHVLYNVTSDNQIYGDDANDISIGVELCYYPEDKARTLESYKKYIWFNAWLAYEYKLNPHTSFIGHHKLDPKRKVDPMNALKILGKTYEQLLQDIVDEYMECITGIKEENTTKPVIKKEEVKLYKPSSSAVKQDTLAVLKQLEQGDKGLNEKWRLQLLNDELSESDAIGLLYTAINRGLLSK